MTPTPILRKQEVAMLLFTIILPGMAFLVTINVAYASTTNQYNLDFGGNTYVIGYQIENATLDNIEVDLEKQGLQIQIDATNKGSLTITLPRNLIDNKCGNEDLPFMTMVNGKEIMFGSSNVEEISSNEESRTLSLTFPGQTDNIFVGAFSSLSLPACDSLSLIPDGQGSDVTYESPSSLNIRNIEVDKEGAKIIVSLSNTTTVRDGYLRLELARAVIDSRSNSTGDDAPFMITYTNSTHSDVVANYYEIKKNDEFRTLLVELPAGYREVTVSGTQVIPEFPMVQLIIAAAIAGLVGITTLRKKQFWNRR